MKNNQMKHMMKNPKAMMDYQMTGRVPGVRKPTATPLWNCLNNLPPRLLAEIRAVRLCPALGYQSQQVFSTAAQLFTFLGGKHTEIVGHRTLPSESRIIRSFQNRISVEDLLNHSKGYPDVKAMDEFYQVRVDADKLNSKNDEKSDPEP